MTSSDSPLYKAVPRPNESYNPVLLVPMLSDLKLSLKLTMGISLPSLNFRLGIDPVCFGLVPFVPLTPLMAVGWYVDPKEFILKSR